jgi:hypothetical protein
MAIIKKIRRLKIGRSYTFSCCCVGGKKCGTLHVEDESDIFKDGGVDIWLWTKPDTKRHKEGVMLIGEELKRFAAVISEAAKGKVPK